MADKVDLNRKSGVITALSVASLVSIYALITWYNNRKETQKILKNKDQEKFFNNEKNICVLYYHFGQCLCKNIKFRFGHKSSKILYQKNETTVSSSNPKSPSNKKENIWERYPRSIIKSNNFDLLINEPTLNFYDIWTEINQNESYKSGLYAFCNECGTQILNLTFANPDQIQINLDCLTISSTSSFKDDDASNSTELENNLTDWNLLFSSSNPNNNSSNLFHGFEGLLRASSMGSKSHRSNYSSSPYPYPYPYPAPGSSYHSYSNYPLYSNSSNNSYRLRSRGTSEHTASTRANHRSSHRNLEDDEISVDDEMNNLSIASSKSKKYHRRHIKPHYNSDSSSYNEYDSYIDDTYSNYSYSTASLRSSASRKYSKKSNPNLNQDYLNNLERRRRSNSNNIQDEIMYAKQNRHPRHSFPLMSSSSNNNNSLKKQQFNSNNNFDYPNNNSPRNPNVNNNSDYYINSNPPSNPNSNLNSPSNIITNNSSNQISPQFASLNFQNSPNNIPASSNQPQQYQLRTSPNNVNNSNTGAFSYTYQVQNQTAGSPLQQQQLFNETQILQQQLASSIEIPNKQIESNSSNKNINSDIYLTIQEHLSKHLE